MSLWKEKYEKLRKKIKKLKILAVWYSRIWYSQNSLLKSHILIRKSNIENLSMFIKIFIFTLKYDVFLQEIQKGQYKKRYDKENRGN